MTAVVENLPVLGFQIDGWEIVVILALLLVVLGRRQLRDLGRGLGRGFRLFGESAREAGESLGGIYGKSAAEALTPDNQTAELYDPASFQRKRGRSRDLFLLRWAFWAVIAAVIALVIFIIWRLATHEPTPRLFDSDF